MKQKLGKEIVKAGGEVEAKSSSLSQEQIALIKSQIFPGATDAELELFFYECRRRNVHPLDRQIFPIVRNVKSGDKYERRVAFQASIDYLRSASDDTGQFAGMEDIVYGEEIEIEGHKGLMAPSYATATILRRGASGETMRISATTRWREFYPGEALGFMWRKMPYHMLGKCAEAQARRRAFPAKLGGLYLREEIVVDAIGGEAGASVSSMEATVRELPAETEPPVDPRKELKELLGEVCEGNFVAMEEMLKQVSYRKEGANIGWLTPQDIATADESWIKKSLQTLKERARR